MEKLFVWKFLFLILFLLCNTYDPYMSLNKCFTSICMLNGKRKIFKTGLKLIINMVGAFICVLGNGRNRKFIIFQLNLEYCSMGLRTHFYTRIQHNVKTLFKHGWVSNGSIVYTDLVCHLCKPNLYFSLKRVKMSTKVLFQIQIRILSVWVINI